MRRNLFTRLLALSLAVAAFAIAATAWLTTRSATDTVRDQTQRSFESDGTIYSALVEYGGAHKDWSGVGSLMHKLAVTTHRRIAITTVSGHPLVDSTALLHQSAEPLPTTSAALVDAIAPQFDIVKPGEKKVLGAVLPPGATALNATERASRMQSARFEVSCLRANGVEARIVSAADGNPQVISPAGVEDQTGIKCSQRSKNSGLPSARQVAVTNDIVARTKQCLDTAGIAYTIAPGYAGMNDIEWRGTTAQPAGFTTCASDARRAALAPYVAPPVLLYLGTGIVHREFLAAAGGTRTVLAALAVLVVAIGVTVVVGRRLVRPIRTLTTASERMAAGDHAARVEVRGNDDLATLGAAFNAMAASVQATDQQRRALVSDVAHELRTPLANVRGYLEAAQDGVVSIDDDLIASLLDESLLLEHLIDDLQLLALADAGKLRLHPEIVDLTPLVGQLAAAHGARAVNAGVELDVETPAHAEVVADPVRIRQAIGNLVANALRYTPPGGRVTVRVGRLKQTPTTAFVDVVDTGIGIDPDHLPHLFDRFYRADASRTRESGGSGLGLAITRHLVEAHGGRVAVRSAPGAGSTFRILIPVDGPPGVDVRSPRTTTTTTARARARRVPHFTRRSRPDR